MKGLYAHKVMVACSIALSAVVAFGVNSGVALADTVSDRAEAAAVAQSIADAENVFMLTEETGDPYAENEADRVDAGYQALMDAVGRYLPEDKTKPVSLLWLRQPGASMLEWRGFADVTRVSDKGRRVLWTCTDKNTGHIVAITIGTLGEGNQKLTSVYMRRTEFAQSLLDDVEHSGSMSSMLEQLSLDSDSSGINGRSQLTPEESEELANARAEMRRIARESGGATSDE